MATAKKTIRKPAAKKAPVKSLVLYKRCDHIETQLVEEIMKQTAQKTASKAIFSALHNYKRQNEDIKLNAQEIDKLRKELRNYKRMALQVKEWIGFFSNLKMIDIIDDDPDDDN